MHSILQRRHFIGGAALLSAMLLMAGCGGGGSGSSGNSGGPIAENPPTEQPQGTVGVVITDAPSDRFDQILATIIRIELLGDDEPAIIFTGREQIDLKQLANFSELFAIADVDAGIYDKIRLTLADLELVKLNDDGTVAEAVHPKLAGNGKIDLNPRREFLVTAGGTLLIEMDFDAEKSFKYHQSGNGEYHFRPVVFVRVLSDAAEGRLSRIFGRIGRVGVDAQRFELCQKELMSDLDDHDDFDDEHCVVVASSTDTGIFDSSGDPTDFGSIVSGEYATAIGFISSRRDDDNFDADHFMLDAVVIELGEAGTFTRLKGTAQSAVDDSREFDLLLGAGQGFGDASMVTARLQDGSKVYSRNGVRLDDSAITSGVMGVFDGVLMLANEEPDLLKTVLAVLDIDAGGEEVLRGEILTAGEDRRLMLATDSGDRCVDVPLETDIFLVTLVEGRLVSERGSYADLQPELNIDVYGEADSGGCFIAAAIIADQTDVTPPPPAENRPPVADAGSDQAVETGTGVMLDGTGSSDPDGDPITYSWSMNVPDGSTAMLSAADTATPSFTADLDGEYVATLVVNDGELESPPGMVTVSASTTPPPANQSPVADAGPDQKVETGAEVTLDGSGSSDPDGDPITYSWSLKGPDGSTAALSGADAAAPTFTPDVDGEYVAALVVNDGELDSDPDSVTVAAATIVVLDGAKLYADNCQNCHGPLAESQKRGATAAEIQGAIDQNKGGMGSLSFLTREEIEAIAEALNTP
jgi:mono/diheme cytochrome c family protein